MSQLISDAATGSWPSTTVIIKNIAAQGYRHRRAYLYQAAMKEIGKATANRWGV
jgi:hypothetical protein